MSQMYFDVWPADDLNGTALGELTQAARKQIRVADQAIGAGQFTINRHASQFVDGWVERDNLVRVRLVAGGPFDYDDERYVHAFFISDGDDTVVSTDEEGGEDVTRGGPSAIAILSRAVVDYHAEVEASEKYWRTALTKGYVEFLQRNPGEVLRILLRNASLRTPNPLAPSTHHFSGDGNSTAGRDSAGNLWSDSDAVWQIPIKLDHLEVLKILSATQLWWRMPADLGLLAYDNDPGNDLSASVVFEKGVNIRESADRDVHTRRAISDALVEGSLKDGGKTYRWVHDEGTETLLGGRREAGVEYQATPTPARLDRAGAQAIRERRTEYEGPTVLGVRDLEGMTAFVDYVPGDTVTVNVPGIWDELTTKVFAIILNETAAGEYDVSIELEQVPFDGLTQTSLESPCGKCPPSTPYVPGVQEGDPDPCWPYEGTITGITDTGNWWTGVVMTACFEAGVTYEYSVTMHSDDPGAYAWGFGISSNGLASGGVNVLNTTNQGDGPDLTVSGTFVGTVGCDGVSVGWWGSVAGLHGGSYPAHQTFHVQPVGFVPGSPDVVIPPNVGQEVREQITGDGATTSWQTNFPYASGSLRVYIVGVGFVVPSEDDPTTGDFSLGFAPASGSQVIVIYQAAGQTGTGATNPTPTPTPTLPSGAGVMDHGALTGLTDDDHPQYLTTNEGGGGDPFPHGSMGSTETFDPTNGNVHSGTLTADCTFTISAPARGDVADLILWLTQDGTGGWDVTWPGSVTEEGTHDTTPGTTQRVILETIDGGTHWIATWIGSGGTALTVEDDGSPLATAADTLDFVGAGVTATGTGAEKTITIPGGATPADTGIWRPLIDSGTGAVIVDGSTGEAVMGFGPA